MAWDKRSWELIDRINAMHSHEGWCLCVCGDGMVVIDTDYDAKTPQHDAFSFVEAKANNGSLVHQIAKGLHGMIMASDLD